MRKDVLENLSDGDKDKITEEKESIKDLIDAANMGLDRSSANTNIDEIKIVDKPHLTNNDTTNIMNPIGYEYNKVLKGIYPS